jgi:hypothetical protein
MAGEGGGDVGGGDPEADAELGVDPGGHVHRPGPGEDQPHQQRLVQVAADDHLVAGADRGQQVGLVAAGGAVDQEEAAVRAPGPRGQRLGDPPQAVVVGGVEPHVVVEYALAEQGEHAAGGPLPALVPGTGERHHALLPVGRQCLQERRRVVDRRGGGGHDGSPLGARIR